VQVLLGITLLACFAMLFVPAIPQDPAYHQFADARGFSGIPNFGDVISNLPFLFIGIAGLRELSRGLPNGCLPECLTAYRIFFASVALVSAGSGYYHWNPSNASLVWDRLPMAISFMAFFAAIVGENLTTVFTRRALAPLVVLGIVSVFYWAWTEQQGAGDLRLYALVQFLPMLLMPFLLLTSRSAYDSNRWIWFAFAAYLAAKLLEAGDRQVLELIGISGHTLKHLAAAVGAWFILLAVRNRRRVSD
jgi:hypothetical protein